MAELGWIWLIHGGICHLGSSWPLLLRAMSLSFPFPICTEPLRDPNIALIMPARWKVHCCDRQTCWIGSPPVLTSHASLFYHLFLSLCPTNCMINILITGALLYLEMLYMEWYLTFSYGNLSGIPGGRGFISYTSGFCLNAVLSSGETWAHRAVISRLSLTVMF